NSSIIVSWDPIPHAVQYSVYLHLLGSDEIIKRNTSNTNLTVYDLEPGSLYMIKGCAWDPEDRKGEPSSYAGLLVSWSLDREVYGVIDYHVMSDHNLMCNSSSDSCILSPVGCGEVHSIQVTASNDAGPSYPSSPTVFITFPCPPESLAIQETAPENCTLSWDSVEYADSYRAYFKNGAGEEEICNTTGNNCTFHCECGYQYLMMVTAINQAGESPKGMTLNYTTVPCCPEDVSVSLVSTDTLEIMWEASRGADLYETRAADNLEDIRCNDTAPVCALSDLTCDRSYSVVVIPCNDVSGCNHNCGAHTKDTAPCTPEDVTVNQQSDSSLTVSWTGTNRAATYTVSAVGDGDVYTCSDPGSSCDITGLPCGCTFEVSVKANSTAGQSLPSFSHSVETEPCCPDSLSVDQVTQAMTNVSWSHAKGAYSFITSLTSSRGHARCHTEDSHCLMGCITCGTNYTVTMKAYSQSGRMSNCTYQGFSSSICCPSGVRLYKLSNNSLRVFWRSSGSMHNYNVELMGANRNYTCQANAGHSSCDIDIVQCGDVYRVVVAPVTPEGTVVPFCAQRMYSGITDRSYVIFLSVIYRGKRSVE
uniref:Fibronectin type III domain containing 7 n=1 Tax=Sphaeramia orbicularis TaxID=375764 RepID=A0A673CMB9_9TELE